MGASTFMDRATGKDAAEAFRNAVSRAQWDHGHAGYSGTLAEKHDYVVIPLPDGEVPEDYANTLINDGDPRIDNKWGPAGCIAAGGDQYLFFGWASS